MRPCSEALRAEALQSTAALRHIVTEWAELWQRDTSATPFQSPAWLIPWWEHVGEGELLAIAVRQGSRLVGLLPLYIYTGEQAPGVVQTRTLLLLGAGTSDYLGGVFDPEQRSESVAEAFRCIADHGSEWDEAQLHQLPAHSPLLGFARARGIAIPPAEPCLVAPLAAEGVPAGKLADNLRYYRKRAERLGELRFEEATPETALPIFEELIKLHGRRWRERGEPGVLDPANVQQAHRAALPLLYSSGLLRLYRLTLNHQTIAVVYCLIDPPQREQRTLSYYLGGFDPEFRACSPGTLLLGFAAQQATAEGARWLDMLRGEESYKRLWGAGPRATSAISLTADMAGFLAGKAAEYESYTHQ